MIQDIKSSKFPRIWKWLFVRLRISKYCLQSICYFINWRFAAIFLHLFCVKRFSESWLNFEHFAESINHGNWPAPSHKFWFFEKQSICFERVIESLKCRILIVLLQIYQILKEIWRKIRKILSLFFINPIWHIMNLFLNLF